MMTLQDRIIISTEDMMAQLEHKLDSLRRFRYDGQYRKILGASIIEHLDVWDEKIRGRRKDPFTIVVAGEFKRGKSSFINALLKEKIMPVDVTPETMTMNRLSYGLHKNEAVLSGGKRLVLQDEELTREALLKIIDKTGEKITQLNLYRPNEWLKDVCIIDTPGLNESSSDYDAITSEALAQADAVINVFSANAPLSHTEQMYLKYNILPQRYTQLFLVANYCDVMESEENLRRIGIAFGKRCEQILPNEKIYLISALDELCRVFEKRRPNEELADALEAEFEQLRKDVSALVQEKKTVVASDRMQRMAFSMQEEIQADIDTILKGLEMNEKELSEEKEALYNEQQTQGRTLDKMKQEIQTAVENMQNETKQWMNALLKQLEQEDLSGYAVEDILRYYSYYCVDTVQGAVMACLEQHREELLEHMSDISESLGKNLAGSYSEGGKIRFAFRLNNSTWTRGDSITLAVTQLSGNALVNTITTLAGSLLRKKEVEADKGKILTDISSMYVGLHTEIDKNIEQQYEKMSLAAKKLLDEYCQEKMQKAASAIAQYEEMSQKKGDDKKQVQMAAEELQEVLSEIREAVNVKL